MLGRIKNHIGMGMSPEMAELVSTWSNVLLLASLIVAVVSSVLIVVSGNVKETAFKERIAGLQREAETARAEQSSLAVELTKLKTPRALNQDQQSRIAEKLKPFAGVPYSLALQPDREPIGLMDQLIAALTTAGWVRTPWQGGGTINLKRPGQQDIIAKISFFTGVRIEIAEAKIPEWRKAVVALRDALASEGVEVTAKASPKASGDAIHIGIGQKP
jgi:hypothetical protein